jgi:BirA family biotin operon repressor/biotin-[acetyl-CoA-carboxylase] ligase
MSDGARHRIIRLSETGSTNKDAMRLALQGEPLPLWVTAERQTAGRGRAGRTWVSDTGNLQASLAFTTGAAASGAGQLSLVAGVAFFEALATLTPLVQDGRVRLKWPNDLLIGGAKAGGILVETTVLAASTGLVAVIGFGLNVVSAPEIGRPVTSLKGGGLNVEADSVLAALADKVQTWLDIWDEGRGFPAVRAAWLERGGPLGEPITINAGPTMVSGTYQGLSESGALLADVEGTLEAFNFGDVALGTGRDAETGA